MNLDGVLMEIRTFDTTFFLIYSENESIITALAQQFNSNEILKKEEYI